MATTSVVGGSQIDVNSLVSQLVAAERKPLDDQVTRLTTKVTTQISAMGQLMGAMSAFQAALGALKTTDAFSTRQAVTGDATVFTASATTKADPGHYDVEVVQLASAHQISSAPFAGGASQVVGTGKLTLSLGATSFFVDIDSAHSTLADIRDAINAASDNPGVRATLINAADGSHLVLASAKTGAANVLQVSQTGGDGGLAGLAYSTATPGTYKQLAEAKDAIAKVATYTVHSSTNTIDDVIDGVSINLVASSEGETVSLDVTADKAAATAKVSAFVAAYNALRTQITKLSGYNAATKVGGPLLGDALVNGIDSELRRGLSAPVAAAGDTYQTLASIGIKTQADGTLQVDDAKLQSALGNDFDAVGKLFGSTDGVAATMFKQVNDRLASGGAVDARNKGLADQQRDIAKRQADVDTRMQIVQSRYLKQFTALDTLLSTLQSTSSFLSQQIDGLANLNKASAR